MTQTKRQPENGKLADQAEMQAALERGLDTLLATYNLSRDKDFPGETIAQIMWRFCDRYRAEGSIDASLVCMKIANTATSLQV